MKSIKLNFVNFWDGFNKENNFFTKILEERYEVVISDDPDYIISSVFGDIYEFVNYDCIKILWSGEPFSPDFNLFDYAIGFDDLILKDYQRNEDGISDRYLRFPLGILYIDTEADYIKGISEKKAYQLLKKKKEFCNYIYSHQSYSNGREELFRALSQYKKVESAGSFMNNRSDGRRVLHEEKIEYIKDFKFTIAGESVSYPGFMTEKLLQAFQGYTIPIYHGDPNVNEEINSKSFINVKDYVSISDVVDRVREIDSSDKLYIKYLMEPKEVCSGFLSQKSEEFKGFLYNIFDQDKEDAYRRIRDYAPQMHADRLKLYNSLYRNTAVLRKLKIIR